MSNPRVQANPQSSLPFGEEAKPGFRTKTAATRLTPDELAEIEGAAEKGGLVFAEISCNCLSVEDARCVSPARDWVPKSPISSTCLG